MDNFFKIKKKKRKKNRKVEKITNWHVECNVHKCYSL